MFGDDNSYIYVVTWWILEQKSLVDQKSGEFNAEKPKKKLSGESLGSGDL